MSSISFNRKRAKLKQLLGIRARLALLAVILVAPLMLERARSLEDARAKQIAQATAEFLSLARHSADTQREVISSVETMLKSAAYIRASAGGVSRSCDLLRASLPKNLPWIHNLLIAGGDRGLSGLGDQHRFPRFRSGERRSRLDVENDERPRRPAWDFRRACRQRRNRAGGASGPGQHDRPPAGQRAPVVGGRGDRPELGKG